MTKSILVIGLLCICNFLYAQDLNLSQEGAKYKGTYKDGKRSGRGTFTWGDGTKYVGYWENDVMEGYGTLTLVDGTKYAGYWRNGKREGFGTFTWTNGDTYQGQFKNNLKHGDGILKMKDGSEYSGQWENDMANGKGTFIWANKTKYIGSWKDNKRHGQGVTISVTGKIEQGTYDNDRYVPCSCPPNEQYSVEEAFAKADAVFVGKITGFAGDMTTVQIIQYWKGEILDNFSIVVKLGYNSCDWIFFQNESYLFYAKKVMNGVYYTNLCTRTAKLKNAEADIKELEQKIPCIDKNNTSPITNSMSSGYVCGCDGISYRSPNEARKNGVQSWKLGLCGNKK
ncbi:MAG: hypothetical protein MUE81_23240 [Thermoflexibacter sp.]|jgi:hypothetical protein|nr:hypothetical protein [Thermoflexibacter sp.]